MPDPRYPAEVRALIEAATRYRYSSFGGRTREAQQERVEAERALDAALSAIDAASSAPASDLDAERRAVTRSTWSDEETSIYQTYRHGAADMVIIGGVEWSRAGLDAIIAHRKQNGTK